jgi:FecR protein
MIDRSLMPHPMPSGRFFPLPPFRGSPPLLFLAAAGIALATTHPTPARAAESATIEEILDGRELFVDQQQAALRQKATAPQTVSTKNSRGQLSFSGGAAGRLNRFSLVRLGSACFLMEKGQILVSGKQNGCTRSARMSVRGTNYVIDVQEDGSTELSVLEGSVEVEPLQEGGTGGGPATTVAAGEKLKLSAQGVILTLLKLSAGDDNSILGGPLFSGFRTSLPGFPALESYIRSAVPGVNLPLIPGVPPSLPSLPIPRFQLL